MEFEYKGKNVKIDDDYWNGDLVEEIRKKIQGNPELLRRYEEGETVSGFLTTSFVGKQGKEEELKIPIDIKKPIPLLGRVKIEVPDGGLKLEVPEGGFKIKFPRLKISKTTTLDEEKMEEHEEGVIEETKEN